MNPEDKPTEPQNQTPDTDPNAQPPAIDPAVAPETPQVTPQQEPQTPFSQPPSNAQPNQTIAPSFLQPAPSAGVHTEHKSAKRKKIIITLLIILLLASGGAGAYFALNKKDSTKASSKPAVSESTEQAAQKQAKENDAERSTDIKAMHGQIEAYYAVNGHYPSLTNVNSEEFRKENFRGLEEEAFKDPGSTTDYVIANLPAANTYSYAVTNEAGTSCESDAKTCMQYVLTATLSDGTTYKKEYLN